ncbi:MAG: hypothetical protein GC161_16415 [Planctomycetaceae bacterium]|nr:hypothetical protein [Planctomycetaceae bacterium]
MKSLTQRLILLAGLLGVFGSALLWWGGGPGPDPTASVRDGGGTTNPVRPRHVGDLSQPGNSGGDTRVSAGPPEDQAGFDQESTSTDSAPPNDLVRVLGTCIDTVSGVGVGRVSVALVLEGQHPSLSIAAGETNHLGQFVLQGRLADFGPWELHIDDVRYAPRVVRVASAVIAGELDLGELRIEPAGELAGVVQDAFGLPAVGTNVLLQRVQDPTAHPVTTGNRNYVAKVDGSGRFAVPRMASGEWTAQVRGRGWRLQGPPPRFVVTHGGDTVLDLLATQLRPIGGRVVDATGEPLPRVKVNGRPSLDAASVTNEVRTDALGRYELFPDDKAPEAGILVVARNDEGLTATVEAVWGDGAADLVLDTGATLTIEVREAQGEQGIPICSYRRSRTETIGGALQTVQGGMLEVSTANLNVVGRYLFAFPCGSGPMLGPLDLQFAIASALDGRFLWRVPPSEVWTVRVARADGSPARDLRVGVAISDRIEGLDLLEGALPSARSKHLMGLSGGPMELGASTTDASGSAVLALPREALTGVPLVVVALEGGLTYARLFTAEAREVEIRLPLRTEVLRCDWDVRRIDGFGVTLRIVLPDGGLLVTPLRVALEQEARIPASPGSLRLHWRGATVPGDLAVDLAVTPLSAAVTVEQLLVEPFTLQLRTLSTHDAPSSLELHAHTPRFSHAPLVLTVPTDGRVLVPALPAMVDVWELRKSSEEPGTLIASEMLNDGLLVTIP